MEHIDEHVNFVLGDHMFSVRVREVPMCPSAPCSLASSAEAMVMVEFPSSGGDGAVFWNVERQPSPHEELGSLIGNLSSCVTVINDWHQAQVCGIVGSGIINEHVSNACCVPSTVDLIMSCYWRFTKTWGYCRMGVGLLSYVV